MVYQQVLVEKQVRSLSALYGTGLEGCDEGNRPL
jgi:hypothetical protein